MLLILASYSSEIFEEIDISALRYTLSVIRSCTRCTATVKDMNNDTCAVMRSLQHTLLALTALQKLLKHVSLEIFSNDKEQRILTL